eukprot:Phypoly_transcript_05016.p1 GENE.Phypoly_transcript_05016~~Phypoly_transcript_05016.p1  ORF type:complete len:419 (+),score=72.43 Phypoly_transcript_05016:791-2047(+)
MEGVETLPDNDKICLICKKQFSKYTCPKCNVGYCSLPCYKNHSNLCTKNFYAENVEQLMKSQKATDDEKLKMMMAIKKLEDNDVDIVAEMMKEGDSEDEDEEGDAMHKLQNMNLDEADTDTILSMLTPEQQEEFRDSIAKGKIGNWVDVWSPWWLLEEEKKPLVTQISSDEEEPTIPKEPTPLPKIEDDLLKLSSITAHPPSPMLGFNLVEIVYAYAYTLRLFNGDWTSDPVDAATTLSTLSSVLSSNAVQASCVSAIQDVVRRSLQPPISAAKEFSISIILDTANILSQKRFVLAALSNLREMFLAVEASVKKTVNASKMSTKTNPANEPKTGTNSKSNISRPQPKNKQDTIKQIALQTRKAYFYLVWSNEEDERKFEQLSDKARDEWTEQCKFLKESSTLPNTRQEPKQCIIEELS